MMTKRQDKLPISGILLLNKSKGLSSNQALQRVKRLFNAKKAGHTGSLDPMATGMLPICFGEASKYSQYLLDADKTYTATAKLGIATDTGDATGNIIATNDLVNFDLRHLESIFSNMLGICEQVPPMYSALKYKGQPLYKLARQGITVERQPRQIKITQLKITAITENTFTFFVRCSKGTYIRTLIEDISAKLGYHAHMTALHREATTGFEGKPMFKHEQLVEMTDENKDACLLSPDNAVLHYPLVQTDTSGIAKLQNGQQIDHGSAEPEGIYRLYKNEQFFGLVKGVATGKLAALRLMAYVP